MKGDPGHILNLGHGIRPQAKIECMHALVQTVRSLIRLKNSDCIDTFTHLLSKSD